MARKHKAHPGDEIPEMTAADFARARPAREVMPEVVAAMKRARGRPKLERPKEHVTLRLDPVVIEAFKAEGPGWQSRINDVLVRVVRKAKPAKRAKHRAA